MEILSVENVSFSYAGSAEETLHDISFTVEKGTFVTLTGNTGSGKSTLLRMLKRELIPNGKKSGRVLFNGEDTEKLSDREAATGIGFVMQYPDHQIVTDKVWHELAFGLENLGYPKDIIRRRVSEMACYFGIEEWFEKPVTSLSGGQKQLLNLASVMVTQPEILLLDEPTAQLDPIAASDFIATLKKLNRELSLTIILVEHRLEEAIPACDKLLVLKEGQVLLYDTPEKTAAGLKEWPELLYDMPAAVRLYHAFDIKEAACPLTVREGRDFIEEHFKRDVLSLKKPAYQPESKTALELTDIMFRYEKTLPDVLNGLELKVNEGEIFCVLGGNGSGKSTALSVAAGLRKAYRGKIRVFGKDIREYKNRTLYQECLAMLPQDVQTLFLCNTVKEELEDAKAEKLSLPYDLTHLYERHPYDLSGGEQQLLGFAKVLAAKPRLILLDEPTKGLDPGSRRMIADILRSLKKEGKTILIVTHDVEFAAEIADRCAMFFRGEITSTGVPDDFFSENYFYTTSINRMTRGLYEKIVTLKDAEAILKENGERSW